MKSKPVKKQSQMRRNCAQNSHSTMLSRLPVLLLAVLALTATCSAQQDALHLLDEVARQYADAGSYHIEAITESRFSSELSNSWNKELLTAELEPGNRYRYEGQNQSGSAIVVSNGTEEWELRLSSGDYTVKPAGSYGHSFYTSQRSQEEYSLAQAFNLIADLKLTGSFAKQAHFLPEQTITVGGNKIRCLVVTYGRDDLLRPLSYASNRQTFWIDAKRKVIVQSTTVGDFKANVDPAHPPLHPILRHEESTTIYPVVELNQTFPPGDFAFTAPPGTVQVKEFPPPYGVRRASAPANTAKLPDMVGKAAPPTIFYAADGSPFQLSSLRGHPVVVDLWATWCAPCLLQMPALDRLYQQTKNTGLTIVGIDIDAGASTAADFLKRKGYGWADYHFKQGPGVGLGFPNTGVPLLVLIDKDGKILYYHDGDDDEAGLRAAVSNLGPAFAAALAAQ